MGDPMLTLFTRALGLAEPWQVAQVRFEPAAHEIHFDVACIAKRLPCPHCKAPDQPIHDRLKRDWQHLHFFQYRALIHAEVPRVRCAQCAGQDGEGGSVHQVSVPWSRERSGFTLLFEALVVTLARMTRMPIRKIAELLGVSDARLWRSLRVLVDRAYQDVDMSQVDAIGIDEKHVGRLGMVTVVHDGSATTRGRVLHVSQGHKAANVGEFTQALSQHGGDSTKIGSCTMDMAKSFQAGARQHLPNAKVCFDPFHLVKLANEALEAVRRAEVVSEPALKRTRYHWLKDASGWTHKEVNLHWLRQSGLKTARAWRLKERLREILASRTNPGEPVTQWMDGWIRWARRSRLAPFKRLGATFKSHLQGIRNMLTLGNSNGMAESINADIQAAVARARGFRTFENLRTIVYLLKAGLALPTSPFQPRYAPTV